MITKICMKIRELEKKEAELSLKAEKECDKIEKQIKELRRLKQEIAEEQEEVKALRDALEFLECKDNAEKTITFYARFCSGGVQEFDNNWTMPLEKILPEGFAFLSKLINAELAQAETRLAELEKRM